MAHIAGSDCNTASFVNFPRFGNSNSGQVPFNASTAAPTATPEGLKQGNWQTRGANYPALLAYLLFVAAVSDTPKPYSDSCSLYFCAP